MINILRLNEYLVECKDEISEVKTTKLVVDDSEIVNDLDQHKEADNMILLGVIPTFDTSPSEDDSIRHNNYLMFLIVEKTNYSKLKGNDEKVAMWNRTQSAIQKLEQKLIADKETGADGKCPEFMHLDVKSIRIEPVWKLAGCNGWMLVATIEK